jgi:hypothetical protein
LLLAKFVGPVLGNVAEKAVDLRRVVGKGEMGLGIGVFRLSIPNTYAPPRPPNASNLLVLTFSLDGP